LIDNLLENAAKYSPKGGDITTTIWCEDHTAHLTVADQGIGIPAEDLPHIFDRFYRATNVNDRQFVGMGLGLFICRAIAEQHGGRITVDSRQGAGTSFHVVLPAIGGKENKDGQTPNSGH
jgi:two-component system sensor histidine kinase VicK